MRFNRFPSMIDRPSEPSKARLTAARKALQRERDKAPLFASEIAAEQPTPEGRIQRLDEGARSWLAEHRQYIAAKWRQHRAELRALEPARRFQILQVWQYGFMPGSHEYLGNLLHSDYTPSHHTMAAIAEWMAGAEPIHGRDGRRPRLEAT